MTMRRRGLITGLAVLMLAGNAQGAEPVDPPPPSDLTPAEVDRWAASVGLKLNRFNRIAITPEGVFYGSRQVSKKNPYAGSSSTNPSKVNYDWNYSVQVLFERFTPLIDAKGRAIRSEQSSVYVKCGRNHTIRVWGPSAFSRHGFAGGRLGSAVDTSAWERIGPVSEWTAAPPATVETARFAQSICATILQ